MTFGIMVTSKLDSSNTMMMCGSFRRASHVATFARLSRSAAEVSASSTPRVTRSTAATAPDRANLETYWSRRNSSSGSMGNANDSPASATKQEMHPTSATLRRTRNGSNCHSRTSKEIISRMVIPTFQASPGMIVTRNKIVAKSMSMTSTKVAVIIRTSYLNRESTMRTTMSKSESAPDVDGRRSKASHKKLRKPQVNTNAARASPSASDQSKI